MSSESASYIGAEKTCLRRHRTKKQKRKRFRHYQGNFSRATQGRCRYPLTAAEAHAAYTAYSDKASNVPVSGLAVQPCRLTHDAWEETAFTETEEEPDSEQSAVVSDEAAQRGDRSPYEHEKGKPTARLKLLEHPV